MGARVIACASSDEKLASHARRRRRCHHLPPAKTSGRPAPASPWQGVDVIYDPVGGKYASPAARSLGWAIPGDRLCGGRNPKIPLNLALPKGCDIVGVILWGAFTSAIRKASGQQWRISVRYAAEGKISAHVHGTYPLAQTADALKAIADRKVMGKVILHP